MGNCISSKGGGARTPPLASINSFQSESYPQASPSASRSDSAGSPPLGGLSPRPSTSAASVASPGRVSLSSLGSPDGPASPGKQRLKEFVSLLKNLKETGITTDHSQVKKMDIELQSRLIEAQNGKIPGIDLSLLSVKVKDHGPLRDSLANMRDGDKLRWIVNVESAGSMGDLIDHAVAIEAAREKGKLSMVIFDSLALDDRSADLMKAAYDMRAGVSLVLTEAQRTFSGCKIHALHNSIQMFKNQEVMGGLHAQNIAAANDPNYWRNFSTVKKGVEFLPAEFFEHVSSKKTFERLPESIQASLNEHFLGNYMHVREENSYRSQELSISIDKARIEYAELALKN